eukprot:278747_1
MDRHKKLSSFITNNKKMVGVFATLSIIGGYLYYKKRQKAAEIEECKQKWKSQSYDKVVLHLLPYGTFGLNHSPFNIKLEALFRLCKVPYVKHYGVTMSPQQSKSPWIEHRGKAIADSQLIYEYIMNNRNNFKEFNKLIDPDINLTDKQKAIAHSFRIMLEDGFFFILRYLYFILHPKYMVESFNVFDSKWMIYFMSRAINKRHKKILYNQGI